MGSRHKKKQKKNRSSTNTTNTVQTQHKGFRSTRIPLSTTAFCWVILNFVSDTISSFSSSLQQKNGDFIQQIASTLEITTTLEEKIEQLLKELVTLKNNETFKTDHPLIEEFHNRLNDKFGTLLKQKNSSTELITIFQAINDLKKEIFNRVNPSNATRHSAEEIFHLRESNGEIVMECDESAIATGQESGFDMKLETTLRDNQQNQEFLAQVMSRIQKFRSTKTTPALSDLCAIQFANHLLGQGFTLPPFQRSLGLPGSRPYCQTYIAVTDAGPDNIKNTVQDMTILTRGVTVHTEWIERFPTKDTYLVEAYRLPSHLWAARVRLHVGDLAPCSAYIGRGMFEGLDYESMHKERPLEEFANKVTHQTGQSCNGDFVFEAGLLKASRFVASACTSMFINGIAECKVAVENMSEKQAVRFLRAVTANVMRNPSTQFLSAAFNIFKPIYSESYGRVLNTIEEIAEIGIEITKKGGFDKVTWDGAKPGEKTSTPVIRTLGKNLLLALVHKAHTAGLLTYISAGMTKSDLKDAVETGVDGIGIGNDLHYRDPQKGTVGALNPQKVKDILDERDRVSQSIITRGATLLAKLDWMQSEATLEKHFEDQIEELYQALLASNETRIQEILKACSDILKPEKELYDRHIAQAHRLLEVPHPPLAQHFAKGIDWKQKLSKLVKTNDTPGIVEFLSEPMRTYQNVQKRLATTKFLAQPMHMAATLDNHAQPPTSPVSHPETENLVVKSPSDLSAVVSKQKEQQSYKGLLTAPLAAMAAPPRPTRKSVVFDEAKLKTASKDEILQCNLEDAYFVGECELPDDLTEQELIDRGAVIIKPKNKNLPFNPVRSKMYTVDELSTCDVAIFNWVQREKSEITKRDRVMIVLHDGMILDALRSYIEGKKIVGLMGGHELQRKDPTFSLIVKLCYELAKQGFVVVTGGGPGAMEAANLGAYLVQKEWSEVEKAIARLQETDDADIVLKEFGDPTYGEFSLGIPTWWYGHEPYNRFARWQAKFVSNAIREDILVSICNRGIIFAPGAAGTRTEIFQFAVPNAYAEEQGEKYSKPMIFFSNFWIENTLYPVTLNIAQREDMIKKKTSGYSTKIYCVDQIEQVTQVVNNFSQAHANSVKAAESAPAEASNATPAKKAASYVAVNELITQDGMTIGVGCGDAAKFAVQRLSEIANEKGWHIQVVPSSFQSRQLLSEYPNLTIKDMMSVETIDIYFDDADKVDSNLNLIKGGNGALLQEKVLATNAQKFILIADSQTTVFGENIAIPIEVLPLAHKTVIQHLQKQFQAKCTLRMTGQNKMTPFVTDNSNFIVDVIFPDSLKDPKSLLSKVSNVAGVLCVGMFMDMVTTAYFGKPDGTVEKRNSNQ